MVDGDGRTLGAAAGCGSTDLSPGLDFCDEAGDTLSRGKAKTSPDLTDVDIAMIFKRLFGDGAQPRKLSV